MSATPMPEQDTAKPNTELFHKFDVTRADGSSKPGGKHHDCDYFVLDVDHDPFAKAALAAYADACEATHPQLAADMRDRYGLARAAGAHALAEAVAALYFNDSSDYLSRLWKIVQILGGQEAVDMVCDGDGRAYHRYVLTVHPELREQPLAVPQAPAPQWTRDDNATFAALSLVGGHDVPLSAIAGWTDEQCMEAEQWAIAMHTHASDNGNVQVPDMPAHVAAHPATDSGIDL